VDKDSRAFPAGKLQLHAMNLGIGAAVTSGTD